MKKVAVTQLFSIDEEICFIEYDNGTYTKVIDEIETESDLNELQDLIDTGKYDVTELTF